MPAQPQERREPPANRDQFTAALDRSHGAGQRAKRFLDRERGNDVPLVADAHQQPLDDGQRQGDVGGEPGALPGHRFDLHLAANLFDIPPHHVHPHAAAGEARDLLGGRKSGHENQVEDLGFRERFLGIDEPPLHGLGQDPAGVQAATVVLDLDNDESPLVKGFQRDRARGRLARRGPLTGQFDAVVGRVADHVHERIAQLLDDGSVEFRLLPLQPEVDLLAEIAGQIANEPRHLPERAPDRHHPQRHRGSLQIRRDAAELAEAPGEVLVGDPLEFLALHHLGLGDDQFSDQVTNNAGVISGR